MIIDIPNVGQVNFPDSMSEGEINAAAKKLYDESGVAEKPQKSGLGAAFQRGAEQLVSSGQTALESVTKGGAEAARGAQERGADIQRRLGEGASLERLQKVYEEKGLFPAAKELAGMVPTAIVEQAPNIGATLAGAGVGALAGSAIFPGVGTVIGGALGAFAPSYVQQYGGNIQRQAEAQAAQGKPLDISLGAAAGTAAPMAALDVLGTFIPLGGNMVAKILGPAAGKLLTTGGSKAVEEGLLATITKGTLTGIAAEVPTEVTQQMLERAQAGLSLTDKDALNEYGATAFAVSLLGPIGIIGRVANKSQAGRDLAEAQRKAAESNEPQTVDIQTLQLPYDPNVQAPTTYGTTPIIVNPDGSTSFPSEANKFAPRVTSELSARELARQNAPISTAPTETTITEAFADPEDKARIEAARWAEARKFSPAMQKLNKIEANKVKLQAEQQAKLDATESRLSAFSEGAFENGVIRPPTPEQLQAERAKAASFNNLRTVARQVGNKVEVYEGVLNDKGKINVKDPVTGKTLTFNPNSPNIVIDPTEKDIYALETRGLGEDLKTVDKEIIKADKETKTQQSAFGDWVKQNPIRDSDVMDILPEAVSPTKKGYSIKRDAKPFFTKDGSALDDLAARAFEAGLITQAEFESTRDNGGVNAFIRKLEQVYRKEPVETTGNQDAFAKIQALSNEKDNLERELEKRQQNLVEPTEQEIVNRQVPFVAADQATPITLAQAEQLEPVTPSTNISPSGETMFDVPYEFSVKARQDMSKIIPRLAKTLDKMGLQKININLSKNLRAMIDGKITKVNGTYLNRIISLCLDNPNIEATLHHEAIHALKEMGLFSPKEWAVLSKRAKEQWIDKYNIKTRYPDASPEVQIEEAIASAFPSYMKQVGQPRGLLQRIKDFVQRVGNVFRGLGFNTSESVFGKAATGQLTGEKIPVRPTDFGISNLPEVKVGNPIDTNSQKFKTWFGDSIFVDKNNKPLVLYHGTKADITKFRVSDGAFGRGIYLTSDPEKASTYAKNSFGKSWQPIGPEGGNVLPLYVSMKNPKINDTDVFKIKDANGKTMSISDAAKYITDQAKAEGYDGIILQDPYSGKISEVVAFEPIQVKSAIGNIGEFSLNNEDILAEIPTKEKLKAPMAGVDPDYAEKLLNQFSAKKETVAERFKGLRANFSERLITGLFDEFRAIKKYSDDAYMMARISKSIDGGLQGLLEYGQVFNDGGALNIRPGTKGLLEILAPIGKEVDQYQIWKALSRDAALPLDKRSFDPELLAGRDQLVKGTLDSKSRKALYETALKEENELNKSVLKVALDAGVIDEYAFKRFSEDMYYIPFYRMMEDGDIASVAKSSKLTGQYFSKELKGGMKKTNDLMENVLLNWSHILSAAMKNQAAVKTIQAAESMGAASLAEKINGKYPSNTVKVMKDGQEVHYEINDAGLVDAISTISYLGPKSAFLDVAKGFTNALRYGVTLSPAYKVRNLIRDSIQSAAISPVGMNVFQNVIGGLAMSKQGHPTFMAALAGGGIFEMGVAHEGNQAKLIKRLINKGVAETSILDTSDKIKGKLQDALNYYNEIGNKFENANRLSLYNKLREEGKSHLEASYQARDLMDFSMQGQFRAIKLVSSVVPFFNARLQGLYKLGRDGITPTYRVICNTVTGQPVDISDKQKAMRFATISSAVMLASMALYGMYKDDEDFKRREEWDRDNFWWFKIGDTAYRIPKPFEIGALGTLAERTYEQIADDTVEGKVFFQRLNSILANNLSMNPMPQIFKPLIDLYANKDSFTGAPIESAGMQNLSAQERVTNRTSGIAIALGGVSSAASKVLTFNPDAQGISPVQVDYAIKSYLGWAGATAVATADLAVEPFSEGTKVRPPIIDTVAMGFIKTEPETRSKYMTEFYQTNARVQSALADMRHYAELGDSEKVQKLMEEKGNDIALAKVYDKTSKEFAKIRQTIRVIEQRKDISPEDKRAEMNRLRILMSDIAAQMESMKKSLNK